MASTEDSNDPFLAQDPVNHPENAPDFASNDTQDLQGQGNDDNENAWATSDPAIPSQGTDNVNTDPGSPKWGGNAARYEWKDEYGDVGPRNEELERELFHDEHIPRPGDHAADLQTPGEAAPYHVSIQSDLKLQPVREFNEAGLHPVMVENLQHCLYSWPTAIQSYCIPALHENLDVIGIAQTGSGKTAAFLIPIISELMGKAKKLAAPRPFVGDSNTKEGYRAEPLVLIICPTRELANQIFDEARRLCYRSMLRPCAVYGGAPVRLQRAELQRGCDILVGTPGRILDFLRQPNVLSFNRIRYAVIDEADELLQSNWEDDFNMLIGDIGSGRDVSPRFLMFSATFNEDCQKLAQKYLSPNSVRIQISRPGSTVRQIRQQVVWVDEDRKRQALVDLIMGLPKGRTLIFVNSKIDVDYVDDYLFNSGLPSTSLHGDRTQREREDALRAFRTAKCPLLVTTGVSARGLDVINVMHVINYTLPRDNRGGITEYIHRIGRTARIGNQGVATSFYNDNNRDLAPALARLLQESSQPIPDFLNKFLPAPDALTFDEDMAGSAKKDSATGNTWERGDGADWEEKQQLDENDPWGQQRAGLLSGHEEPEERYATSEGDAHDTTAFDKNDISW
ncbi:hypothetical protein PDE_01776 [Penicillium oxalicum 114-2]|uniref:RNA helicase n=1 Tax=Penicillium oxalicum (strain 114-2 / CGMCC 5302) TaxID=933388 RepID=S8AY22_PENO1|nr:hypothetical protein PDE_01776 [Penicillium oxalicum 114-2]